MCQVEIAGCGCHLQESRVEAGKFAHDRRHFECFVGRHHPHGMQIITGFYHPPTTTKLAFLSCRIQFCYCIWSFKFIENRFEWKNNWPFLIGSTQTSAMIKTLNTCYPSVRLVEVFSKKLRTAFYYGKKTREE